MASLRTTLNLTHDFADLRKNNISRSTHFHMASKIPIPCHYYAQGSCRNGGRCKFIHDPAARLNGSLENLSLMPKRAVPINTAPNSRVTDAGATESTQICSFFLRGSCFYGEKCRNRHTDPGDLLTGLVSELDFTAADLFHEAPNASHAPFDSRSTISCQYQSRPGGCRNSSCKFLHTQSDKVEQGEKNTELGENEDVS